MDESKLTSASRKHLNLDLSPIHQQSDLCIELRPYKLIQDFLKWFVSQQTGKIWVSINNQLIHNLFRTRFI